MQKRTLTQNKSLHKGFTEVANIANERGVTLKAILENTNIPVTDDAIKIMYKSVAKAMYNVDSTTELSTAQISKVWDVFIKPIEELTGEYIPFPSRTDSNEYYESLENYLRGY